MTHSVRWIKLIALFYFSIFISACSDSLVGISDKISNHENDIPSDTDPTTDPGGSDDDPGGPIAKTIPAGATWYWQLQDPIYLSKEVDVYDIDLFDTSIETISTLKDKGIRVICYFSAGSIEKWRVDKDDFPAEAIGEPLGDWLNLRHKS